METNLKESDRWYRQAEYDFKVAEWNVEGGFFAPACFWAQQAAAKALRAFLYINNESGRETRSVVELLDRAISYEEGFKDFVEASGRIDLYYKTSRFPDAIPGGIPAEVLIERDAKEAIKVAGDIINVVAEKKKNHQPDTL